MEAWSWRVETTDSRVVSEENVLGSKVGRKGSEGGEG